MLLSVVTFVVVVTSSSVSGSSCAGSPKVGPYTKPCPNQVSFPVVPKSITSCCSLCYLPSLEERWNPTFRVNILAISSKSALGGLDGLGGGREGHIILFARD